jgi:hypothetical protein
LNTYSANVNNIIVYKGQDARLPAKALISSFTLRLGSRLNTSCKKKMKKIDQIPKVKSLHK